MTKKRRWRTIISWGAIAFLLLAFALRTYALGKRELTFDEVASFYIANRSLPNVLTYLRGAIREHPPLYYLFLSLWLPAAGQSEFSVRFLSVASGMVTIAAIYRISRWRTSNWKALLPTLLLTISPFHIRISQDARMYALLALWSLLSYFFLLRLLNKDTTHWWALFWLMIGLGMFTHYFMIFVLGAIDFFLLLYWRRYRHLWGRWAMLHTALGSLVAFWAILSPGLSATLLSLWRRGFASGIRWGGLARAVNGIYLGTSQNPNWHHLSLPLALTVISFGWSFGRRQQMPRRSPDKHILLGLLLIVPTGSVLLLPERLTGRYLTPAFPASILLMGEAGKQLVEWTGCRLVGWIKAHRPIHKLQSPTNLLQPVVDALLFAITCLLFAGVLIVNVNAYPAIYLPGGDSFRDKMAFLKAHAKPNDALLLHVSWQSLLLTYYDAGPFKTYTIPAGHFQAEQAKLDKALTEIFDTHDRVWVSYSFVEALDPEWLVSRWLHEHTHRVRSFQHLVLYHSAPSGNPFQETQEENSKRDGTTDWPNQLFLPLIMRNSGKKYTYADQAGVVFGDHLRLDGVAMANQFPAGGDAVLLYTRWVSIQDISQDVQLWLTLIGPNGETWAEHHSYIGPFMVSKGSWQANETFIERSGLVVPISTPPGDYRLRVQVFTADGDEWLPENDVFEVGPVRVRHFLPADRLMQAIPNYGNFRANFGDKLALIGYEPGGLRFTSGNPLMFEIYWQALVTPSTEYKLSIEVIGDDKVLTNKLVHPVADWIPTNRWQDGDVLMGHHVVPLPIDASPGSYQVRLSVHTPSGTCLPVRGTYTSRVFNRWSRKQSFSGTSVALFDFTIEAPSHRYRMPAMQHHIDATLGSSKDQQELRLLGYELSSANVEPGDEFELTLYWKALSEMDRIYAAFIHLISPDNILVAQRDKWLGGGTYHTTHWVPREIVEEHYTVSVPQDISSGEYELRVGIYDAASGKQAVTMVDGAVVPGGYVLLQKVTVE